MKKFITITVVLMFMLIFVGCATTPDQGKEKSDLRSSVGNSHFVGDPSMDAKKAALGIGMR